MPTDLPLSLDPPSCIHCVDPAHPPPARALEEEQRQSKIVSARLGQATAAFTLDAYTGDVPELHHAAETVSDLFLGEDDEGPDEPPNDLL
ncbi:hypothetical protein [Pseudonocardia sp. H11422]|uniref:hypothetical protein n=1 Tax=Pseudonocardia sp. H11422 TaxID=2835866 RepID=UPI001BDBE5D7|nr:hypothetical protein [Pseudonocardia sp. H11422]